jgi:hypothetical protein
MKGFAINKNGSGLLAWFWGVAFLVLGPASILATPSCTLIWDANSEPELAGYRAYYGTASGHYTQVIDVGNAISTPISGLAEGSTYYFVVTAYDSAGFESEPSIEVTYAVPNSGLGTWQRQYFTAAELADLAQAETYWGDLADPDRDGRNNILEYALGRSPLDRNDGNQGILAQVRDDGNGHFQYLTFLRRKNDVNLAYEPQVSGDKQTWQAGAGSVLEVAVQNLDADFEWVTYKDLAPVAQSHPRFFQLKVIRNATAVGTSDIYVTTAATVKGNGGSKSLATYFSLSMVQPWVACGTITALGANTLSDANATWSEDRFNGVNGAYYLEFASGLTVDIVDTQAATRTLVVPGDLRAVLAVGEVYRIRKHVTLVDVFGANNEAGLLGGKNASRTDNVVLYDAAAQTSQMYFYYNVPGYTGWYRGDFRPATNVTIYPEQGIVVSRKTAADTTVYMGGVIKTGATWVPIEPGFNLLGTVKTVRNMKLSELNLLTGNPATGLAEGANASAADNVALPNQNGWALYFYCNIAGHEGWYDGAFRPAGTVEIPAGSAFSIKRKAPRGGFDWVIPAE